MAVLNGLRLRRAEALIDGLFENSFDAIAILGKDGRIDAANAGLAQLFGYTQQTLAEHTLSDLLSEEEEVILPTLKSTEGPPKYFEASGLRRDGSTFPVEFTVGAIRIGGNDGYIAIVRDISDRKSQQEQLRYQALHDALTDLPNRFLFNDRLDQALEASRRSGVPLAIIILDLDRFKEINDTLGHFVGDMLLRDVAGRLRNTVRKCDTVARLGGDEFAVILSSVASTETALELTERLMTSLCMPLKINGLVLDVEVSAGIAMFPEHATDRDKLLQCSDVAMYDAKEERTRIAIYNAARDRNSIRNLTLCGDLRSAIQNSHIFLEYQPKIDLRTGTVVGVEALARWTHEELGVVPPTEFVAHAERAGTIHQLTQLTLSQGFSQIAEWRRNNFDLTVSINLSARSLHDMTLPETLSRLLVEWDVKPEWITLEVTESTLIADPHKAMEVAERLADLGLRLAVDDFGTGYSSLAYLSSLPVTELKIDRSFVAQMLNSDRDLKIVQAIVDLAHNLALKVVAEGVENAHVLSRLARLGCDTAQGYFLGKPMSAARLAQMAEPRQLSSGVC